jgi:hypothetical protein
MNSRATSLEVCIIFSHLLEESEIKWENGIGLCIQLVSGWNAGLQALVRTKDLVLSHVWWYV